MSDPGPAPRGRPLTLCVCRLDDPARPDVRYGVRPRSLHGSCTKVVQTFEREYLGGDGTGSGRWESVGEVLDRAVAFAMAMNASGARRERALRKAAR